MAKTFTLTENLRMRNHPKCCALRCLKERREIADGEVYVSAGNINHVKHYHVACWEALKY